MKAAISIKLLTAIAAATLVSAGCKVGPNYREPSVPVADQFDVGPMILPRTVRISIPTTQAIQMQPTTPTSQPGPVAISPAPPSVDLSRWWESFGDAELNSLVQRAFANNDDLAIAVARLQQARAVLNSTDSGTLPGAEFSAGAGRGSGTNSTKGRVSAPAQRRLGHRQGQ